MSGRSPLRPFISGTKSVLNPSPCLGSSALGNQASRRCRERHLYTEDRQQHSRCPPSPSLLQTCQVPAGLTALCWVSDTLCCGTPGSHPRGLSRACWEQNTGTRMDHCALRHCCLSCIKLRESAAWKSTHRSCQPSVPHVLREQTLRAAIGTRAH